MRNPFTLCFSLFFRPQAFLHSVFSSIKHAVPGLQLTSQPFNPIFPYISPSSFSLCPGLVWFGLVSFHFVLFHLELQPFLPYLF